MPGQPISVCRNNGCLGAAVQGFTLWRFGVWQMAIFSSNENHFHLDE